MGSFTVVWLTTIFNTDDAVDAARQARKDSSKGTSTIYMVYPGDVDILLPEGGYTVDLDQIDAEIGGE